MMPCRISKARCKSVERISVSGTRRPERHCCGTLSTQLTSPTPYAPPSYVRSGAVASCWSSMRRCSSAPGQWSYQAQAGSSVSTHQLVARASHLHSMLHSPGTTSVVPCCGHVPLPSLLQHGIMTGCLAPNMQGDRERDMGMPVSALCDRNITDWPKSQAVFLDCVVRRPPIQQPRSETTIIVA